MERKKVLFICTYNGTRSRIAEEFTKLLAPEKIEVYSSSFEPSKIGPLPIAVMKEVGIDLLTEAAKSVYARFREKEVFDYVVTLCHEATTEQCPIFKMNIEALYGKKAEVISWSIPDFMSLSGAEEEQKIEARKIRDLIKGEVMKFLSQIGIETTKSTDF